MDYQALRNQHELIGSMRKRGDCYDHAAMESWNHSYKIETIHGECFATRLHAEKTTVEYIDFYYNVKSRHSANDQQSPLAYELANAV